MNLLKAFFVILFICCFQEIFCEVQLNDEIENVNKGPNISGDAEFYLKFVKGPANYTIKNIGSHIRMKCGVTLSRFINETLNSSFEFKDVQNTTDFLLRKVRIKWFRKESQIGNIKNKITIKRIDSNGTVWSILRIHNIDSSDKGSYYCTANIGKNNSVKSSQGEVDVEFNKPTELGSDSEEAEVEISYNPLFTSNESEQTTTSAVIDYTIPLLPETAIKKNELNTKFFDPYIVESFTRTTSQSPIPPAEGICQLYTGRACIEFLDGQHVFIPYPITQAALEEKLIAAFKVVNYSNEISSNCVGYAIPSLCFSTFPVCITPNETNTLFFQHFDEFSDSTNNIEKDYIHPTENTDDDAVLQVQFDNMPPGGLPPHLDPNYKPVSNDQHHAIKKINDRFKRFSFDSDFVIPSNSNNEFQRRFSLSRSANALRRVCRDDCEILEDELCQIEYAIAKRHPEIGQKLTLEECKDLPLEAADCLQIGIEKHFGCDTCYWETGIYYRGNVNVSMSGLPCNKWSSQFIYKMANHPELTGKHNYCRNPGGKEPQPWCYVVTKDRGQIKEFCDIPKCSQKIWLYIIAAMLGAFLLISFCLMLICCRQRNSKNNTAAIRNINLPNADKNIYGNSRLNSPIELSDLLTHNPNSRRNGISRVPQYSLAQIKFVEELGEGAFGKVYKGELTRDGEKVFVAVKALKENASQKTQQDFKREIELISELHHENIVCILGVVLREEPLCMLFEFMAKGDLHEFLMSKVPPEGCGLSPTQFLMIAQHIASGMEYLAAHHYVHRDLAARNCLVSDNLVVKISDFGLSRDIYSSDYYRVQSKSLLPVRWMPPESILYGKFTTESDVWSYAIVLWEIYSYGLQPYYGYSNQDVINMVRNRQLLQCPNDCPRAVYSLMKECWHQTPSKRPTFTYITQRLSAWLRPNSNLHCDNTSDSSGVTSSQKALQSVGDPRERIPLIGNHSSSNGSLAGSMPRKLSTAGSIRSQGHLMMSSSDVMSGSDLGENSFKGKKSSCGSLLESSEKLSQRDTVIKLPNVSQPFDI